jgi:hypothetical protein
VRERDAVVVEADRRAGRALREMTEDEGLSVREAVKWCGGEISTREAVRMRRLAGDVEVGTTKVDDNNSRQVVNEHLRQARES